MHVRHLEPRLQCPRRRRDVEWNRHDPILRPFDLARSGREEANSGNDQRGNDQGKTNQNPFLHGYDLLSLAGTARPTSATSPSDHVGSTVAYHSTAAAVPWH